MLNVILNSGFGALILQQEELCSPESSNALKHAFNSSQVVSSLTI